MTTVEHPMLTMRGIRKQFAGIEVLHGVDFDVAAGEVHALVGHNGAGKSTLMKVLAGVYPEFSGSISIDGEDAGARTPKEAISRGVATIYQDFALIPDLDAAHNIALGREPSIGGVLIPHRRLLERSAAEGAEYGISLPMRTPVRELGVAQQQLTEIVRALAREVKVLVMDEPTARLAPRERETLFGVIRALAARGVAIIYISHFLDEVLDVADRVTILRDGAVVDSGPSESFTTSGLARALVGDDDHSMAAQTRRPPVDESAAPRLEVRGLTLPGRPPVDLAVRPGEVVAIAGLVGSGRTRLMRAIVGDLHADGVVLLDGKAVPRSPVQSSRRGLLLVPEDRKRNGLVLTGTVTANIELTALAGRLARAGIVLRGAVDEVVAGAIRRFGIRPAKASAQVASLSGGNAQKVLVARAVVSGARALLFDQPTAGVDVGAKAELHREILALAADGAAVVVISDDLDETIELVDRVLVLVNGGIVAEHRTSELTRAGLLEAISIGTEGPA